MSPPPTAGDPAADATPPSTPPGVGVRSERLHPAPLRFHGKASEYFGIWLVNLVLTLLTLGIYSAWAKVRARRYIYGSTELDGERFSYLADPLTILKGRLIALGLLVICALIDQAYLLAQPILALVLVAAIPWLLARALRFNARMSAYRNVCQAGARLRPRGRDRRCLR